MMIIIIKRIRIFTSSNAVDICSKIMKIKNNNKATYHSNKIIALPCEWAVSKLLLMPAVTMSIIITQIVIQGIIITRNNHESNNHNKKKNLSR